MPMFRWTLAVVAAAMPTLVLAKQPASESPELIPTAQPAEPVISFAVGDADRRFESKDALGSYLAIHALPAGECSDCMKSMNEHLAQAETVAGVRHIFVRAVPTSEFTAFLGEFREPATIPLYRDEGGALTAQLRVVPSDGPALIVLDPRGVEIQRWIGQSASEHPSFAALVKKITEHSTDRETKEANLDRGLALQGYDPVAYFDEHQALPGVARLESMHRGVKYRFATSEHRKAFNEEPAKYLPTYGGWCATAMAEGKKVEIDPKTFKVTDGRLFLFYNGFWGNALNDWKKNEPALTARADEHWTTLTRVR